MLSHIIRGYPQSLETNILIVIYLQIERDLIRQNLTYPTEIIADVQPRSQASLCGICGGQSGTERVFSEYFGFTLSVLSHQCSTFIRISFMQQRLYITS
jgi:hypothetical protein